MPFYFVSIIEQLSKLSRWKKRTIVFFMDLALLFQSVLIAYSLRLGFWVYWSDAIRTITLGAILVMIPCFWLSGIYRAIFRYAGVGMLRTMVHAFAIYTAAMIAIFSFYTFSGVPRTLGLIQPIIFFLLVASSRVTIRFLVVDILGRRRFSGDTRRVLIYGAGEAGQQLMSSIRSDPSIKLCGFLDDDWRLDGQTLDKHSVFHADRLTEVVARYGVTDVLLALPSVGRIRRRAILEKLSPLAVEVRVLPQIKDMVGGSVSFNDVRPIEIEDLLGREPVRPNEVLLGRTVVGKSILVTGAGGSIGSELCRQVAAIGAQRIVLFDLSEYALYSICSELELLTRSSGSTSVEIACVLGSVRDKERVEEIFKIYKIDTVFHAAAYKHVPLVEDNPVEAIRNNILGTWTLAEAARDANVLHFILISSDKAVRPTNVMGATKRAAEQILQGLAATKSNTRFSMVRFGNVLGSSGSVVPLFRMQIARGGPVTLTHRDVTRYFMTIPEAANLVIQAAGMAKGGEVFVLDMGKPTKIRDLAESMVHLSGLKVRDARNPDGDIEIREIGLRSGEKLYEELLIGENPAPTSHPRILMAREHAPAFERTLDLLQSLSSKSGIEPSLSLLSNMVPEFEHRRDNKSETVETYNRVANGDHVA